MAIKESMTWTFHSKAKIPSDVEKILVDGEKAVIAYKTIRDVAVVTNKRFIIADKVDHKKFLTFFAHDDSRYLQNLHWSRPFWQRQSSITNRQIFFVEH